ncbi:MAG: hypothetical protein GTO41_28755 [Burkholderiales bacterium]|nr:hypothetical protein [Burkholderiales bacterium]
MNRFTLSAKYVVLCMALAMFSAKAWADSGTFESLASFTKNYKTMQYSDGTVTGGTLSGTQTVISSSGGPFVAGANDYLECIVLAVKTSAGMDLQSPCAVTTASGDKMFVIYLRKAGDTSEGSAGEGTSTISGGTGQYAGISGRCTYAVEYLPNDKAVTRSKCNWRRP